MKKYSEDMAFVCYYVEKKHKDLLSPVFSVLFSQQLDDRRLMGMAKIGTNEMPV